MKRILQTLSALALIFSAVGNVQAIPLTDLFNGQSITAGDKVFDQFKLIFQGKSDGSTVNTNNINVTALNDGGLDPGPGLMFNISNQEFNVQGDGIYAYLDFQFGFHVSVLDPNLRINGNSLAMANAFTTTSGQPINDDGSFILEKIGTAAGLSNLGSKNVEFSTLDDVITNKLTDTAAFASQSDIWVTKNILVWATDVGDQAGFDSFSQRFSQGIRPSQIPEPATLTLMGLGLAGLSAVRRRKAMK
ncbi:PEP-CTERM sorting domain-containing protein [Sulfurirhabdus autotrophica]|uniref:Putative secreted protein n=2 Tax=Sulfurirhabdus autotrophica TaxID=1706046 RepID=A0A4R3Y8B2_9PROT|nr:PEP-CTERM sorting domain-containing protein [Sulfurirhabdus autotrophica]TCV88106.1 putative secreted protein [Sulfurirhabdus autotrophica]